MKIETTLILSFLLIFSLVSSAQESSARIVFWNIENLFDPEDDSIKRDEEFTPEGMRHWTKSRYYQKVNKTAKVLIATGDNDAPALIGLCEIENAYCVKSLTDFSPLKNFGYSSVHHESPDRRGVDVALLYRTKDFIPIYDRPIHIRFPFDSTGRTRDILYVKGLLFQSDTVHIFVNHWPSRYGGYMPTKPKRAHVASVLKQVCDSIQKVEPNANIVIGGDFNDDPTDESMISVLKALPERPLENKNPALINLMYPLKEQGEGTLKHKAAWNVFDMVIVSSPLLFPTDSTPSVSQGEAHIFYADYLVEEDEKNLGLRLNRTYIGMRFHGGYSDHLPVYVDIVKGKVAKSK